jgi:hypothetical protein
MPVQADLWCSPSSMRSHAIPRTASGSCPGFLLLTWAVQTMHRSKTKHISVQHWKSIIFEPIHVGHHTNKCFSKSHHTFR